MRKNCYEVKCSIQGSLARVMFRELDRFDLAGNKLRVTAVDSAPRRRSRSRSRERRRRRRSRSRDKDNDQPTPDPANGAVGRIALMNKLANREPVVPEPKVRANP